MASYVSIGSAAALVIAGGLFGIHLGHSAVAEIKPAYFQAEAPSRFFADLTPQGYQDGSASTQPIDLWAEEAVSAAPHYCGDCSKPEVDDVYSEYSDRAEPGIPSEQYEYAEPQPPPSALVARYADFPVTEQERPLAAASAGAERGTSQSDLASSDPIGM